MAAELVSDLVDSGCTIHVRYRRGSGRVREMGGFFHCNNDMRLECNLCLHNVVNFAQCNNNFVMHPCQAKATLSSRLSW